LPSVSPNSSLCSADRSAPAVDVAGADERGRDAETRQRVVQQVVRAAVQRAGADDVRAGSASVAIARCKRGLPLAVAIAPVPPSSAATRSSSTALVGFEIRL
jgi:hypothetical protein